jgi:hypothetical protein
MGKGTSSVNSDGSMTVLEQNAPDGEPVARNTLFFTGGATKQGNPQAR